MSAFTDLLGTTSLSSDEEHFYNMIKAFTDTHYGTISGMQNIVTACNNEFTPEEIDKFCKSLEYSKPGFSCDRITYHGISIVNTIHIRMAYDQNGNRKL